MRPINVVIVCGVRPHFVKCAALQRAIGEYNSHAEVKIDAKYLNAGQHYNDELAGSLISELGLQFDCTLSHDNKNPLHIFGNMIIGIGGYLANLRPKADWVVVFGDANVAAAAALAAVKTNNAIAHFEAGTALHDIKTVEVINGKILASISEVHFCSSDLAAESLRKVGIRNKIFVIGDVARDFVIDSSNSIMGGYDGLDPGTYILLTMHHEENLESALVLRNVLEVLNGCGYKVVFVIHPRTKKRLEEFDLLNFSNILYAPPQSYKQMLAAIKGCKFLVTDSGGLQRESYYLRKRCLIRLDVDYWPSLTQAGVHKRIGIDKASILEGMRWIESVNVSGVYPQVQTLDHTKGAQEALTILARITNQ